MQLGEAGTSEARLPLLGSLPSLFSLSLSPVVFQAVKQTSAPRAAQAASRLPRSTCPQLETSEPLSHASRH